MSPLEPRSSREEEELAALQDAHRHEPECDCEECLAPVEGVAPSSWRLSIGDADDLPF